MRARLSPVGEGLQVLVYTPDQPDLFARICGYFDQAGFSILDAKVHTASNGYALDTFQVVSSMLPEHNRELISMVESDLDRTHREGRPAAAAQPRPRVAPRQELPDRAAGGPAARREGAALAARRSRPATASGLLYSVARVLARHHINLQLAKVSTLGERVEDTFLIDGPELQQNKRQIEIETELLEALGAA